jgi:glycosyltransferase involved in cell wall biosynthesis
MKYAMIAKEEHLSMTTNDAPLVSVITATYNAGDCLESSIISVFRQTYPNYEYIVIDGASTDNTIQILKDYDSKITFWMSEPDSGLYEAWNKAIEHCRGEWILFIGADDQLLPDALETYVNYINNHTERTLEYISSRAQRINSDGTLGNVVGNPWKWSKFKKRMTTAHPGSFHSRKLFERYGIYNTKYRIIADYEMLLRTKDTLRAGFINKITVQMAISERFQEFDALNEVIKMFHDSKHLPMLQRQIHCINLLCRYHLKRFLSLK